MDPIHVTMQVVEPTSHIDLGFGSSDGTYASTGALPYDYVKTVIGRTQLTQKQVRRTNFVIRVPYPVQDGSGNVIGVEEFVISVTGSCHNVGGLQLQDGDAGQLAACRTACALACSILTGKAASSVATAAPVIDMDHPFVRGSNGLDPLAPGATYGWKGTGA